jgi:hypothetical protein
VISFVGYKYAREKCLDLSLSSDGFEPVEEEEEEEEEDDPLMSPYHSGYAASLVSESPSASFFQ